MSKHTDQKLEIALTINATVCSGVCLFLTTSSLGMGKMLSVKQTLFVLFFSFWFSYGALAVRGMIKKYQNGN